MRAPSQAAHHALMKSLAQMGHLTSLHKDAAAEIGGEALAQYLTDEGFKSIEQALACFNHDEAALFRFLADYAEQYESDNGPFGVGA